MICLTHGMTWMKIIGIYHCFVLGLTKQFINEMRISGKYNLKVNKVS